MADRPKARQSQLVTTYGVGSLFPSGEQSYMICGTDDWDEKWAAPIEEPRLARSLQVQLFREPPSGRNAGDVPAVRFPTYQYCPGCRRLGRFWEFDAKKMRCQDCVRDLAPSRFVACCEQGHIEDFPYFQWIHRDGERPSGVHRLTLTSDGRSSSLDDLKVSCSCGVTTRSLDGAFGGGALVGIKRCGGHRPWLLGAEPESCDKGLRVLQRGSSNVWYSVVRSAISIPPWSSPSARFVTKHWQLLQYIDVHGINQAVQAMVAGGSAPGVDPDEVAHIVMQRKGLDSSAIPTEEQLRAEEYLALRDGHDASAQDTFRCVEVEVSQDVQDVIAQVSKVSRLREVRALQGFTRVTAIPTTTQNPNVAAISLKKRDWLPATEVLGEGVFIRLQEGVVAEWERSLLAARRQGELARSMLLRASEGGGGGGFEAPSARFLAIHSLAHALLHELSLEAGYPVGSLRERIYAEPGQAGVLMYTASSDAAGSLGGLAALSHPEKLAKALIGAVLRSTWCSNDPVCSESGASGTDGLNLAACHACLLVPETSCEHRNLFLDRVAFVGAIGSPDEGLVGRLVPLSDL